jgi:hypothetical protein
MGLVSILMGLGAFALLAWLIYCVRAMHVDIRELLGAFRGTHGRRYSDPSAAAVVTEAKPKPEPSSEAAPAAMRSALPRAQAEDHDGDRETPDEGTRVWTGKRTKRPTRLGGLADAPQEPNAPTSSKRDPLATTLVSQGNEPRSDVADADDGSVMVEAQRHDGMPLSNRPDPDPDSDPDSDEL